MPAGDAAAHDPYGWLSYVIGGVVLLMILLLVFRRTRAARALMYAFMPGRPGRHDERR